MQEPLNSKLLLAKEAALYKGVSLATINHWAQEGKLKISTADQCPYNLFNTADLDKITPWHQNKRRGRPSKMLNIFKKTQEVVPTQKDMESYNIELIETQRKDACREAWDFYNEFCEKQKEFSEKREIIIRYLLIETDKGVSDECHEKLNDVDSSIRDCIYYSVSLLKALSIALPMKEDHDRTK
jgi:hypothetical protein